MSLESEKVLYKNLNRKFNGLTKPREREFRYMHGHFKIRQKSTIRNPGRGRKHISRIQKVEFLIKLDYQMLYNHMLLILKFAPPSFQYK